jgi:hypothetical protein
MADSAVFTRACELLEKHTSFSALEARGTVRLALKGAGLDARNVGRSEMMVAVRSVLEPELRQRGVADPGAVCKQILEGLASVEQESASPYDVFSRLGA